MTFREKDEQGKKKFMRDFKLPTAVAFGMPLFVGQSTNLTKGIELVTGKKRISEYY